MMHGGMLLNIAWTHLVGALVLVLVVAGSDTPWSLGRAPARPRRSRPPRSTDAT